MSFPRRTLLIAACLFATCLLPAWASAAGATTAKAGIASSKYLSAGASSRLSALGASWSYDWSATAPPAHPGLEWVPMIWGAGSLNAQTIRALSAEHRERSARYLLGFNEPDNAGQSNMTPTQAADLWPELERTGLILGSPAPAVPTDGWLSTFMKLARTRHLRVNFIALHYYQDFTDPDAVAELRSQLIGLHRTYGLPIWITEIGSIDIRAWGESTRSTPTPAKAAAYMRRLFPMLEALPFVQRYAWFTDNCWNDVSCHDSSLINGAGQLTSLGLTFHNLAG